MENANPFVDIQLSLNGTTVTVQYKVDPQFKGRAPFKFNLIAYEDDTFTNSLYTISSNTFFVVDDQRQRQTSTENFLYKLQLIDLNGVVSYSNFFGWSPSSSITRHHYLIAYDLSRRERLRLNYTGIFSYLLKRKNYGTAQTCETDPITGEPVVDDTVNFGVGEGGYYPPILTRFSIESRQIKEEYDENGRGTQYTELLNIRTTGFPFFDQHDIIVTPDGKRFTITDPVTKYFPGTTLILLQLPNLRLIPATDTVYSIVVPAFPKNE